MKRRNIPCALTIAGSDSGGGAGIQADLKTFAALGVHGTSAITCITAQNPGGVRGIKAVSPGLVLAQIEAVFAELKPGAVKTGMLYSRGIIETVADYFSSGKRPPLVVDPVMISTSGAKLLKRDAERAMRERLIPLATLLTPNLDEAGALTGLKLKSIEDLPEAARWIHREWGCAALVKGGHLRGVKEAADLFFDGRKMLLLTAPFVRHVSTHGTGCTYSAAITAGLARGLKLSTAVVEAKEYITRAIAGSKRTGNCEILDWG